MKIHWGEAGVWNHAAPRGWWWRKVTRIRATVQAARRERDEWIRANRPPANGRRRTCSCDRAGKSIAWWNTTS